METLKSLLGSDYHDNHDGRYDDEYDGGGSLSYEVVTGIEDVSH